MAWMAKTGCARRGLAVIRQLPLLAAWVAMIALFAPLEAARAEDRPQPVRWEVWLSSGSSIRVAEVVPDDPADPTAAFTRLVLPAGGSVRVASESIRRLAELEVEEPTFELIGELPESVTRWDRLVESAAAKHSLDPDLVRAVILYESAGNPDAVSPKGAIGLMQLLPTTAADYGVTRLRDPASNLEAGCRHLARLSGKMNGDLELTLAAYNAGEGAVARFGGVPAYTETRDYVRKILSRLERRAG
jgi:soluble lytic murein transglycosylase-like protein